MRNLENSSPMVSEDVSIRSGIVWGTFLSILPGITSVDILRTVVLAIVGAIVSFLATKVLKWFVNRRKK